MSNQSRLVRAEEAFSEDEVRNYTKNMNEGSDLAAHDLKEAYADGTGCKEAVEVFRRAEEELTTIVGKFSFYRLTVRYSPPLSVDEFVSLGNTERDAREFLKYYHDGLRQKEELESTVEKIIDEHIVYSRKQSKEQNDQEDEVVYRTSKVAIEKTADGYVFWVGGVGDGLYFMGQSSIDGIKDVISGGEPYHYYDANGDYITVQKVGKRLEFVQGSEDEDEEGEGEFKTYAPISELTRAFRQNLDEDLLTEDPYA